MRAHLCAKASCCFDSPLFGCCVKMMTSLWCYENVCACWSSADATLILACSQAWGFVLWRVLTMCQCRVGDVFQKWAVFKFRSSGLEHEKLGWGQNNGGWRGGGRGKMREEKDIWGIWVIPQEHARSWRIQERWRDWRPPFFTIITVEILTRNVNEQTCRC